MHQYYHERLPEARFIQPQDPLSTSASLLSPPSATQSVSSAVFASPRLNYTPFGIAASALHPYDVDTHYLHSDPALPGSSVLQAHPDPFRSPPSRPQIDLDGFTIPVFSPHPPPSQTSSHPSTGATNRYIPQRRHLGAIDPGSSGVCEMRLERTGRQSVRY
ncbi:hypothetical protein JCM16303_007139 [Sporobolomyces ruberrimus]